MHLVLVDYGAGNLHSAAKALERAARESGWPGTVETTRDIAAVRSADRIVLPGVGAFGACMARLNAVSGLRAAIEARVAGEGAPLLGICVGMQMLAEESLEFGRHAGLGWIKGRVVPLAPQDPAFKVPHMGWNALAPRNPAHPLLAELGEGNPYVYFVHSYHLQADEPVDVLATADYGGRVTAMVARGNIAGTQFHPEKSQGAGLQLLANFLRWRP